MNHLPLGATMVSSIRQFWRRLENSVHPEDEFFFRQNSHTFNLDFPPPAFIGDVDNARVVILELNGGYCPKMTPAEFPRDCDLQQYIDWLKGTRNEFPENLSTYYTNNSLAPWLRDGTAVIVNAVAYRSTKISEEKDNEKLARILPSFKAHKQWLTQELLPQVEQNKRFVIAHRWTLWRIKPRVNLKNFVYDSCPASPHISNQAISLACDWLKT